MKTIEELEVGDYVRITRGHQNWDGLMDEYIGKIVRVEGVTRNIRWELGVEVYVHLIIFDGWDGWMWVFEDGHFEILSPKRKIMTPKPLDLKFSTTMFNFLTSIRRESKIAKMILKCMELHDTNVGELHDKVLTASEVNYITYRSDGTLSYLPKGKEHVLLENGNWSPANRQSGKPAKVMRKIFTKKALKLLKETDFELFNNKYKSRFSLDDIEFKELDSTEIPNVYCMKVKGTGSVSDSCMRGDRELLGLYETCKNVKIVAAVYKNRDLLAGRALLWDAIRVMDDGTEVPIKFLDRFYTDSDSLREAFVEYAIDHDYWYKKKHHTFEDKTRLINPATGLEERVYMYVNVEIDQSAYPYIDTFPYGDHERKRLVNDNDYFKYDMFFNSTDGGRERYKVLHGSFVDEKFDLILGSWHPRHKFYDITAGQYEGAVSIIDNTIEDYYGERWWKDDPGIVYSNEDDCYIPRDEAVFVAKIDSYVRQEVYNRKYAKQEIEQEDE